MLFLTPSQCSSHVGIPNFVLNFKTRKMIDSISIKCTARIAGFLYLLQIPLGVLGIVYVPKQLIVANNLSATVSNILANEFLFRSSIISAILCALVTVATAYYIHKVLRPVNSTIAKAIVLFTILVAPISILNELNNVAVLVLLKTPEYASMFSVDQLNLAVAFFLDLHKYGIWIVDIFFGLWLLPMSYLVINSGYIPKIIGFFLILTCLGYLIDFITAFLLPNFDIIISEYTWLGEVLMVAWLLIVGIKQTEYDKYKLGKAN